MQFGFMLGCETPNIMFTLRQLRKKYLAKKKSLYLTFVDLEKHFARVPRDVFWWTLRKLELKEWLVRIVQPIYRNVWSFVRVCLYMLFQVGLHLVTVLSPLLFIIVLGALSREIRSRCPREILCVDGLTLVSRLRAWKGD